MKRTRPFQKRRRGQDRASVKKIELEEEDSAECLT
jgi:hypothetical protein